jgi:hypothetical protein
MNPTHCYELSWRVVCTTDPEAPERSCVISDHERLSVATARLIAPPFRSRDVPVFAPPAGLLAPWKALEGLDEVLADLFRAPRHQAIAYLAGDHMD